MTETYARVFPCGCFIELDIAYDWVDGQVTIEEVSVKECGGLTTNSTVTPAAEEPQSGAGE